MKPFFAHRRAWLTLLLCGLSVLLYLSARPALSTYWCDQHWLTETQIATQRQLTLTQWRQLRQRGLLPEEICVMPDGKVAQALSLTEQRRPDQPDEALRFRLLQQQDENGVIPADGLQRAMQHTQQMRAAQRANVTSEAGIERGAWTWLGPGNIGGRIRSMVIHPITPTWMWVGSVSGGVWKTTTGGASWQPVDDFMANLAVSTLVMDPTNPNILYAGTGEGFYNADGLRGAGIFKSADGGATWTQLSSTTNANFYYVNRLAIAPSNGLLVLAGTSNGIWRSTNGGVSWTRTYTNDAALDLNFHPTDSTRAIASGWSGAWYSVDSGVTWNAAAGLPTTGRVEVAYAPSSPNIVYASVDANNGEVWRSVNGGQSYTRMNTGNYFLGSQGWYDNALWVDPTDANTLVVGGIDLWRSRDGGASLTKISQWWSAPNSAHADHHFILHHPNFNGHTNKTVYFTNDGGVYRADDVYGVFSVFGWQELNNNLGITQFYGAAGNATSGVIVGGTQDNGTLRYAGGTETWTTMSGGDGGWSAADPSDPNYFYGEYVFLQLHRSTNAGLSSSYIHFGLSDANSCANFIAPFILDPNNPNTLLAGGCSLWRSTNVKFLLPSWSNIKPADNNNTRISALAVAPGNSNLIWVGHNNGDIYMTTNGTAAAPTWVRMDTNSPPLPNRYVTRITIDRNNSNIVYVTFGGFSADNVWRTNDGGATWSELTGAAETGLPNVPVRSLVIHPNNSNWLYVGTEVGIFTSEDGGATWRLPHDGPANVSVDELFWMNTTLVAATHGRGLFSAQTNVTPQPDLIVPGISYTPTNPLNGQAVTVTVQIKNQGSAAVNTNFWLDLYVDRQPTGCFDYSSIYWGVSALAAGATQSFIYPNVLITGTRTLAAFVDSGCAIAENNENNNIYGAVTINPGVPNDDIGNAFIVSPTPYSYTQSVTFATTANDDPILPCAANSVNGGRGAASVWYRYVPPTNGRLSVNTIGSNYDTVLALWRGARGSLANVACNDDITAGTVLVSSLQAEVLGGVTYYIEVANYKSSGAGVLRLAASFAPCYSLSVNVNPNNGGGVARSVAPNCVNNTQYLSGTLVVLTATASNGYTFTHWTGNVNGNANPISVTMNSNQSVAANFVSTTNCNPPRVTLDAPTQRLAIPNTGAWVERGITFNHAPPHATVSEVRVRYRIQHDDPAQLEVRLLQRGSGRSVILWNRQAAVGNVVAQTHSEAKAFDGVSANGEWVLQLRSTGGQGALESFSVLPIYAYEGPRLGFAGTGERGTPLVLQRDAHASPMRQEPQGSQQPVNLPAQYQARNAAGWQVLKYETFEGAFTNTLWVVSDENNDGYVRYWDDDNTKAYAGSRAAWPARGGTQGVSPSLFCYPHNMDTWMIYGPFDLSNATDADTYFQLWREIEAGWDYVFFGVSTDTLRFYGYFWDGSADWEFKDVYYTAFTGQPQVWIAWYFYSDASVAYRGSWIDDVVVWRYVTDPVLVKVASTWTADMSGTLKTTFNVGENIRYYGKISNMATISQTVYASWAVNGPCGSIASWSGELMVDAGVTTWYVPTTIPLEACGGAYTYQLSALYDGATTFQSTVFTVTSPIRTPTPTATPTRDAALNKPIYLPLVMR